MRKGKGKGNQRKSGGVEKCSVGTVLLSHEASYGKKSLS